MMFRRLLESNARAEASRAAMEGLAVSMIAHLALVLASLAGSGRPAPTDVVNETMSIVEYLLPPDQLAGTRPQAEKVEFSSEGSGGGAGYDAGEKEREPIKLEVPVTAGIAEEEEAAEEAFAAQPPLELGDSIMTIFDVDSAVERYEYSAAPSYPELMLRRRIEGRVLAQYVVDTTGFVDTTTFRVLEATNAEFVRAVRKALPFMRFRPAKMGDRRVSQLVQQPFTFQIAPEAKPPRPPDRVSDSPQ